TAARKRQAALRFASKHPTIAGTFACVNTESACRDSQGRPRSDPACRRREGKRVADVRAAFPQLRVMDQARMYRQAAMLAAVAGLQCAGDSLLHRRQLR